jgi:hypothetical protein
MNFSKKRKEKIMKKQVPAYRKVINSFCDPTIPLKDVEDDRTNRILIKNSMKIKNYQCCSQGE